jgi:hypothetical protein
LLPVPATSSSIKIKLNETGNDESLLETSLPTETEPKKGKQIAEPELNTKELAEKAMIIKERLGLSVVRLIEALGGLTDEMKRGGILKTDKIYAYIKKPVAWRRLNDGEKSLYRTLNEWVIRNENAEPVVNKRSSYKTISIDEEDLCLNTCEISDKVKAICSRLEIRHKTLSNASNIPLFHLGKLLNYPDPWDTLCPIKKQEYKLLNTWVIENESRERITSRGKQIRLVPKSLIHQVDALNTAEVAECIVQVLDMPGKLVGKERLKANMLPVVRLTKLEDMMLIKCELSKQSSRQVDYETKESDSNEIAGSDGYETAGSDGYETASSKTVLEMEYAKDVLGNEI